MVQLDRDKPYDRRYRRLVAVVGADLSLVADCYCSRKKLIELLPRIFALTNTLKKDVIHHPVAIIKQIIVINNQRCQSEDDDQVSKSRTWS